MRKGGYKIIDFKSYNFTSAEATEKTSHGLDIYDSIESTNKRTVVSGLVVGGTEYDDMEVHFKVGEASNFNGTTNLGDSTISITVSDTNTITVTVA